MSYCLTARAEFQGCRRHKQPQETFQAATLAPDIQRPHFRPSKPSNQSPSAADALAGHQHISWFHVQVQHPLLVAVDKRRRKINTVNKWRKWRHMLLNCSATAHEGSLRVIHHPEPPFRWDGVKKLCCPSQPPLRRDGIKKPCCPSSFAVVPPARWLGGAARLFPGR